MNAIELALKKQRLQLECAAQRQTIAAAAAGLQPAFDLADHIRAAAHWLKRHPEVVLAGGIAVAVARPHKVVRWARRGLFAWQGVRKLQDWIGRRSAARS
jgi:hypothetical protein